MTYKFRQTLETESGVKLVTEIPCDNEQILGMLMVVVYRQVSNQLHKDNSNIKLWEYIGDADKVTYKIGPGKDFLTIEQVKEA